MQHQIKVLKLLSDGVRRSLQLQQTQGRLQQRVVVRLYGAKSQRQKAEEHISDISQSTPKDQKKPSSYPAESKNRENELNIRPPSSKSWRDESSDNRQETNSNTWSDGTG
ncbi:hypothetical protein MIR68_008309 [Amoeboaphelidium protococcarum]|nr:hypothetical protein MIR68_008309 [Amoeboaphelidium protococcarum]